jgi:phosphoribosyl 1,2-cyclic phosphate phosphodiesterase
VKITFLGTGTSQGIPVIGCRCSVCTSTDPMDKRLRCSVLLEENGTVAVIDSGPDFRQQMLRSNVSDLNGLVFTHEHKDHVAGMDDIRAFNYIHRKKVDVYATSRVQLALRREFPYIFEDSGYPGIPQIELHTIGLNPFNVGSIQLIPIEVMHYKLPVLGFRTGDFTYITDANFISDSEKEKIKGSKIIAVNALRRERHVSHFTLAEAVSLLEELKPDHGYLIHLSHQLGKHKEVNAELPSFIRCAYDGLTLEI